MHDAEYRAARLAVAGNRIGAGDVVARVDRIAVDVEAVLRVALVVQLDVAGIKQSSRRQAVAVADFILLRPGVRTFDEATDGRSVRCTPAAIVGAAIKQVDLAATHGNRARNAPQVALQVAGRRFVLRALVYAGESQAEALHYRAEIVREGGRPVGIACVKNASGHSVLANLVVALESEA